MNYKKTPSRATKMGQDYEIRMAALLFLRLLNCPAISNFQLATNVDGADSLDDIVMRYKTDDDYWKSAFIQLKHIGRRLNRNTLRGSSKKFSLKEYLKSFSVIDGKMSTSSDREELFNGSLEHCNFIIYTIAEGGETLVEQSSICGSNVLEKLLVTEGESRSIWCFEEDRDRDILLALQNDGSDVRAFLQGLMIIHGQANANQLISVIKKEIEVKLSSHYTTCTDIDRIYDEYEKLISQWWTDDNVPILDENSDIFETALNNANAIKVYTISLQDEKKHALDLKFEYVEDLDSILHGHFSLTHVTCTKFTTRLNCTSLLQFLPEDSYIFLDTVYSQKEHSIFISTWSNGERDLLVILNESSKTHDDFCDKIIDVLNKNVRKKVVVISPKEDSFIELLKIRWNNCRVIGLENSISQLADESLLKIKPMDIVFQGFTVPLDSVLYPNSTLENILLSDNLVESLLTNQTPLICEDLPKLIDYYIPRNLEAFHFIKHELVQFKSSSTFAVSDVTHQELQVMVRPGEIVGRVADVVKDNCQFVILDPGDEENCYNLLCKSIDNIHWIRKQNESFIWMRSQGNMETIYPYLKKDMPCMYNPRTAFDFSQRCVLIAAEPGMGKSTLSTHLARSTKDSFPSTWVVLISMVDHVDFLGRSSCENAIEFLLSATGVSDLPFESSLLKHCLEETGNVVVFLDGFDEIWPTYKDKVNILLRSLLRTKVKKVFVTFRIFMKETMESNFSTLALSLKEFTENDQIACLKKMWKHGINGSPLSDNELENVITKLLRKCHESLNDFEKIFTGIPLQTVMLGEVFKEHIMKPEMAKVVDDLDLVYLFDKFVEKKFNIYIEKTCKNPLTNDSILEGIRKDFTKKHMNAALVTLFYHANILNKLHSGDKIMKKTEKFMKNIQSGVENTGLICSVTNNVPTFLHRCFAEFFAAKWFCKKYHRNQKFLSEYMFLPAFEVVRRFFDALLSCSQRMFRAVVYNDFLEVKKLVEEGEDVNAIDLGGRSAVHLAAAIPFNYVRKPFVVFGDLSNDIFGDYRNYRRADYHKNQHILDLLLSPDSKTDVNLKDTVFEWTPLQYAIQSNAWNSAEILLHKNSNVDNVIFDMGEVTLSRMWESIAEYGFEALMKCALDLQVPIPKKSEFLHRSIMNGHIGIVKHLVNTCKDIYYIMQFKKGTTLLHQAARCGQCEILLYLIEILKMENGNICENCINSVHNEGYTAMHLAFLNGFLDILDILLSNGGDVQLLEKDYKDLLYKVCSTGHLDSVKRIIESIKDDPDKVNEYINHIQPIPESITCIMIAALNNHSSVLKYLISQGGNVKFNADGLFFNVLHMVVCCPNLDNLIAVIEGVGDDPNIIAKYINTPDRELTTAVHRVSACGFSSGTTHGMQEEINRKLAENANFLVLNGGNVKAIDNNGRTPLHWAAYFYANVHVARVFIESFGNDRDSVIKYVNTRDYGGQTAKDLVNGEFNLHLTPQRWRMELESYLDSILKNNYC